MYVSSEGPGESLVLAFAAQQCNWCQYHGLVNFYFIYFFFFYFILFVYLFFFFFFFLGGGRIMAGQLYTATLLFGIMEFSYKLLGILNLAQYDTD